MLVSNLQFRSFVVHEVCLARYDLILHLCNAVCNTSYEAIDIYFSISFVQILSSAHAREVGMQSHKNDVLGWDLESLQSCTARKQQVSKLIQYVRS